MSPIHNIVSTGSRASAITLTSVSQVVQNLFWVVPTVKQCDVVCQRVGEAVEKDGFEALPRRRLKAPKLLSNAGIAFIAAIRRVFAIDENITRFCGQWVAAIELRAGEDILNLLEFTEQLCIADTEGRIGVSRVDRSLLNFLRHGQQVPVLAKEPTEE
jgi:hypothetical protein